MEGNYTIVDLAPSKALNALDDVFSSNDKDYFITGGFNVQTLIAAEMMDRLRKAGKTEVYLSNSSKIGDLYRATGDVDAVADFMTSADLMAFLNDNRFGRSERISFVGQGEGTTYSAPYVRYELYDSLKQPLKVNIYASHDPFYLATEQLRVPVRKSQTLDVRALVPEALIAQKLASARNKDIGDVERLILVFGDQINSIMVESYAGLKNFNKKLVSDRFSELRQKFVDNA